jgi:hypothetical protein
MTGCDTGFLFGHILGRTVSTDKIFSKDLVVVLETNNSKGNETHNLNITLCLQI